MNRTELVCARCVGAVGVVWTVAFCFSVYESPRDHPRITREETDYIRVAMGADAVDPDAAVSQQVFHARYDTLRYDTIRDIMLVQRALCGRHKSA